MTGCLVAKGPVIHRHMVGGLVKAHGIAGYMKSGDCCGWRGASTILRAHFSHIQVAVAGLGCPPTGLSILSSPSREQSSLSHPVNWLKFISTWMTPLHYISRSSCDRRGSRSRPSFYFSHSSSFWCVPVSLDIPLLLRRSQGNQSC